MSNTMTNHTAPLPASLGEFSNTFAREVEHMPIDRLRPFGRQARTHTPAQIQKIAASVREFGFLIPIIRDDDNRILAGLARLEAAKRLGMTSVPTLCISHLTDEQKRAFVLAENRLAELAGWDRQILAEEFRDLIELDVEFDLQVTGFTEIEIEALTVVLDSDEPDEAPAPSTEAICALGDLWRLGENRLFCGDATLAPSYEQLMEGGRARAAFLDPPYNVPIQGHVTGNSAHREFVMGAGELSDDEFTDLLSGSFTNLREILTNGGIAFVCMDWRHAQHLLTAASRAGLTLVNLCVWTKPQPGMGSFYRSQHELVFVFRAGDASHLNRVELGKHGRSRSNVWAYPSVNGLNQASMADHANHPTPKPVAMVRDALLDCTARGDIVVDNFAGGGSTLIAAEMIGRRARLIELDPIYCDVIIKRWQAFTGGEAVLAASGETFAEVSARQAEARRTPVVRQRRRIAL